MALSGCSPNVRWSPPGRPFPERLIKETGRKKISDTSGDELRYFARNDVISGPTEEKRAEESGWENSVLSIF